MTGRSAVFLDRDGVLNEAVEIDGKPHPPASVDAVRLLPGVVDACRELRSAGLVLVVVTNQPDIARGATTAEAVAAINDAVCGPLGIDEVAVCPHDDADGCHCRKPRPGMLTDAAARHGLDLARSTMVGDRWRDIDAGHAAGTATVFVDRGWREAVPRGAGLVVQELIEAVPFILGRARQGRPLP